MMAEQQEADGIERGLTDALRVPLWVILAIVATTCGVGACLYEKEAYSLISVRENLVDTAGDVFLKYVALVAAIERAAAVFVGIFRNRNNVDWTLRINRISEILQQDTTHAAVLKQVYARERYLVDRLKSAGKIQKAIAPVSDHGGDEDYRGYLTSAKHVYEFQRGRFNSISNRYVTLVVFFVGVVLAGMGLSVFHDLFEPLQSQATVQGALLRFGDIFVTGGLLGGGSAGLNAVATKVTEFLNTK